MTNKEKLVEATVLALQGRLTENEKWTFELTKNSDYPGDCRRKTFTDGVQREFKESDRYETYMKALDNLEKCLNKENIFIEDVQVLFSWDILALIAICKNTETENLKYDEQIESGIAINVDENQNIQYRFIVDEPISINVKCSTYPNQELIKSIKSYLETFKSEKNN